MPSLVRRVINPLSLLWNSSAVCILINSKWTALELANVKMIREYNSFVVLSCLCYNS